MGIYRPFSLILALIFAVTGILFLFWPGNVLSLFNTISSWWGMAQSPVTGQGFYLILAAGYMYVVTVLGFLMFRHPENRYFPMLLINAKGASAILSLALFLMHEPYLIYLANFIVDGVIAAAVSALYFKARRTRWVSA